MEQLTQAIHQHQYLNNFTNENKVAFRYGKQPCFLTLKIFYFIFIFFF